MGLTMVDVVPLPTPIRLHDASRDEPPPWVREPYCYTCRYWQEDREDAHLPRWGYCLRPASAPLSLMAVVAEDGESGAALRTHPRFACREYCE